MDELDTNQLVTRDDFLNIENDLTISEILLESYSFVDIEI